MSISIPSATTRWRCRQCGNLTRFDVVRSRRTKEYWHFDLSGDAVVESSETVREIVESVTCRWCNAQDSIELIERPDSDEESRPN